MGEDIRRITDVEHLPHQPKVEGLTSVTDIATGRKKKIQKIITWIGVLEVLATKIPVNVRKPAKTQNPLFVQ